MKLGKVVTALLVLMTLVFTGCFNQKEEEKGNVAKVGTRSLDGFTSTYDTMYLRGTPNAWGSTAMVRTNNYEWSLTGVRTNATTTERFKFDVDGKWTTNFGDRETGFKGTGIAEQGGADIVLQPNKVYYIIFNDQTKAYKISEVADVPTLTLTTTSVTVKKGTVFKLPLKGKFTVGGVSNDLDLEWVAEFGDNSLHLGNEVFADWIGSRVYTGTVAGMYNSVEPRPVRVLFTVTGSDAFASTYPTMNLRGTPNNWGITPMVLTADYTWSLTGVKTLTSATERFKFDVKSDWVTSFGLNGGTADIPLDSNSSYNITFNDKTKAYTLTKITVPTLTIAKTSDTVKKGTAYTLPVTGTYTKDGVVSQVVLAWTPAVDTSKTGVTVYSATANGLTVTFTLTVTDGFAFTYPTMYFRGTPNGWGATTKMTLVADYTWQTEAVFAGITSGNDVDRFKFDAKGDWTVSFGDNEPDGIADLVASAKDILVKGGAGKYVVTFNDKTSVYSATKIIVPTLTIGTTVATVKKGNTTFVLPATGTYTKDGAASQVSLSWTPALDTNKMGDTVYSATSNGLTVTFTLTVSDAFVSTYPTMYFRGTPNNWTATTKMTLIADYTWQTEADFAGVTTGANRDRFKFDAKGDWTTDFGDNEADGIADRIAGAKDIYVNGGAGKYGVTFNDKTRVYSAVKQVVNSKMILVGSYYIGKYEVTQAEFQSVMGFNPSYFKGVNNPVESVTWYDAVEYCNEKSIAEKLTPYYATTAVVKSGNHIISAIVVEATTHEAMNGWRLPTRIEWEYASRGGASSSGYKYSGSNDLDVVAWHGGSAYPGQFFADNSGGTTHPVGTKAANELGIYDMNGNVDEWTSDTFTYSGGNYGISYHTIMGGCWGGKSDLFSYNMECGLETSSSDYGTGIRLVRSY